MKKSLTETTFIIPLRIDSDDRLRNSITVISFLLHHFDTTIILHEIDTEPKFRMHALPKIREIIDTNNLEYKFLKNEKKEFHRTKIINDMLMEVKTKVVCNYDIDILLELDSYKTAQELIITNDIGLVYPFGEGSAYEYGVKYNSAIKEKFFRSGFDLNFLKINADLHSARHGHCQFFNTHSYIKYGLENENFIGWGYEDDERFFRFSKFLKVRRIDKMVYHLDHKRNSSFYCENNNKTLLNEIKKMDMEQLSSYYKNQDYYINRRDQLNKRGKS